MNERTTLKLIGAGALAMLLAACNLTNITGVPPTSPIEGTPFVTAEGTDGAPAAFTDVPAVPTITPTLAFTPTPLPDPPQGWLEYQSQEAQIRFFYPPDWEVALVPNNFPLLDVRAQQGEGWLEINLIDANSADLFSLSPEMLGDPQALAEAFRSAAETDGEFSAAHLMETRTGVAAWNYAGTNEIYEDRLWVGVMSLTPNAVIALGHAKKDTADWDSRLVPLYQQIVWSIQILE